MAWPAVADHRVGKAGILLYIYTQDAHQHATSCVYFRIPYAGGRPGFVLPLPARTPSLVGHPSPPHTGVHWAYPDSADSQMVDRHCVGMHNPLQIGEELHQLWGRSCWEGSGAIILHVHVVHRIFGHGEG